jgi:hypothetical protein
MFAIPSHGWFMTLLFFSLPGMMIFIHFGEKLGFRADPRIAWNMVMNNKMFSDVVPSASWP